jgi:hypothetical protein
VRKSALFAHFSFDSSSRTIAKCEGRRFESGHPLHSFGPHLCVALGTRCSTAVRLVFDPWPVRQTSVPGIASALVAHLDHSATKTAEAGRSADLGLPLNEVDQQAEFPFCSSGTDDERLYCGRGCKKEGLMRRLRWRAREPVNPPNEPPEGSIAIEPVRAAFPGTSLRSTRLAVTLGRSRAHATRCKTTDHASTPTGRREPDLRGTPDRRWAPRIRDRG